MINISKVIMKLLAAVFMLGFPILWIMIVIGKYGTNPLTIFPILLYILMVLVGMGVIE